MVRFSPSIKTFCLYVIREKQDQIWAKIFYIPKNMDSRTLMCFMPNLFMILLVVTTVFIVTAKHGVRKCYDDNRSENLSVVLDWFS